MFEVIVSTKISYTFHYLHKITIATRYEENPWVEYRQQLGRAVGLPAIAVPGHSLSALLLSLSSLNPYTSGLCLCPAPALSLISDYSLSLFILSPLVVDILPNFLWNPAYTLA